jgi:hypothetical protein
MLIFGFVWSQSIILHGQYRKHKQKITNNLSVCQVDKKIETPTVENQDISSNMDTIYNQIMAPYGQISSTETQSDPYDTNFLWVN